MNRYAAHGLLAAAIGDHRRVLVVTERIPDALAAFDEALHGCNAPVRVRRTNGAERIDADGGGSVQFTTPRSERHRGRTFDTVYVDAGCGNADTWTRYRPCLAASPRGEMTAA